jgi:hypothetical protein
MRRFPLVISPAIVLALVVASCGSNDSAKPLGQATTTSRVASTTATTPPQPPTPFEVLDAQVDALNQGDVAGSVAYFAPYATLITALGRCVPCIGRSVIREHWSGAAANQTKVQLSDPKTVGDTVTARTTMTSPQFPAGIARAIGRVVATVHNGKITRLDQRWDAADPQTAALLAIVGGTRSKAP